MPLSLKRGAIPSKLNKKLEEIYTPLFSERGASHNPIAKL